MLLRQGAFTHVTNSLIAVMAITITLSVFHYLPRIFDKPVRAIAYAHEGDTVIRLGQIENRTTALQVVSVEYSDVEYNFPSRLPRMQSQQSRKLRDYTFIFKNNSRKPIVAITIHFKVGNVLVGSKDIIYKHATQSFGPDEQVKIVAKGIRLDCRPSVETAVFQDNAVEGDQEIGRDFIVRWAATKEKLLLIHAKLQEIAGFSNAEMDAALENLLNSLNDERGRKGRGINYGSSRLERDNGNRQKGLVDAIDLIKPVLKQWAYIFTSNRNYLTIKPAIEKATEHIKRLADR